MCAGAIFQATAGVANRSIPHPLLSHPGNIFIVGEMVVVAAQPGASNTWQAVDYEGKTVAHGLVENGLVKLGQLPVGYYEVITGGQPESRRISVGVLEPLHAPTPFDSPIGIDVALA